MRKRRLSLEVEPPTGSLIFTNKIPLGSPRKQEENEGLKYGVLGYNWGQ